MIYQYVSERKGPDMHISGPEDIHKAVKRFGNKKQEHFLIATLTGSQNLYRIRIITIGLLNRVLIHPREVFVVAIKDHAAAIVLCHNHPSGEIEPSREDDLATQRLCSAGLLLGIPVLDHLIFTKDRFYSYRSAGKLLDSTIDYQR